MCPNLGFLPATALPKYSFSDAKLRFWRLVSEKNTCVGIPKGINRGAHKLKTGRVTIPDHGQNKEVAKGTENSILKQAGLK